MLFGCAFTYVKCSCVDENRNTFFIYKIYLVFLRVQKKLVYGMEAGVGRQEAWEWGELYYLQS